MKPKWHSILYCTFNLLQRLLLIWALFITNNVKGYFVNSRAAHTAVKYTLPPISRGQLNVVPSYFKSLICYTLHKNFESGGSQNLRVVISHSEVYVSS